MSGITPILDTLLHQVLGKRVDLPPPRDLNEAVKPLQAGTAPQAVHSDSRLDPRPPPAATGTGQASDRSAAPAAPPAVAAGSTSTHFSAAARDIAEVLARFPAPPSTLRLAAPLLAPGGGSASPAELAARLKSSIDSSGLFYESHLARWYRGGLGREQLAREPQMQASPGGRPLAEGAGPASATPTARAGMPAADSSSARTSGTPQDRTPAEPPARAGGAVPAPASGGQPLPEGAARERAVREWAVWEQVAREQPAAGRSGGVDAPPARAEGAGHGVNEALQGVVRQQLEMLAMPVLRWEGDVWSGLFMAFTLHFPEAGARDGQAGSAEGGDTGTGGDEWVSELRLEIAGLGDVEVSLRMFREQLELGLATSSAAMVAELAARREEMETRLARCGFEAVSVRISDREGSDG